MTYIQISVSTRFGANPFPEMLNVAREELTVNS